MKYFEFGGGYPYYALICAVSPYEALGLYVMEVTTVDEEWWSGELPEEITIEDAKSKFIDACEEDSTEQQAQEFERLSNNSEPSVLLIDGSLI